MSYQKFRVVDGKIIEEDEETFLEREKKTLEGIVMPVSYTCLLCNTKLHNITTKAGLYKHWKIFHSDENEHCYHSEDGNSETEKTGEELPPELSLMQKDEKVEYGKDKEEPSCEKTIPFRAKPLESERGDWEADDSDYFPKDVFTAKRNVIYQNMTFKTSPSPDKKLPLDRCCMHEITNNLPGEMIKNLCGCGCVENLQDQRNQDFSTFGTSDSLKDEDWGPMPELSPQCTPSYDKKIDDNNFGEAKEDITEKMDEPKKMGKKRKPGLLDYDGLAKKAKEELSDPMTKANLYDAMRRGEKLWWCKLCDDYLKSVDLLKYHIALIHNEDISKINRFNIATWDLEIARTFTSPHEIELEYELNLRVPDDHTE